jgi:hypothetical protein
MKSKHNTNQRIIIAGNLGDGSTEAGLIKGFRNLGWDVLPLDAGAFFTNGRGKFNRAFARVRLPFSVRAYNDAIIETVEASGSKFFLTVKGSYISGRTLERIRELGVSTVNYYPDYHFEYAGIKEQDFTGYDVFFTTKSFQVDYLRENIGHKCVSFLHHGYLSGYHAPPEDMPDPAFTTDIVYIGNHTQEKEAWLRSIKRRLPAAHFKIYGNRWDTAQNREIFGESIAGFPLYGRDYAKAIYSARTNIAIHMGRVRNSRWADLVSTRTFEIPACKGFMLHVDNEEVRQLFTPGVEIDVFKDADELCEKIEYYLAHDDVRRHMVERAYQRCVPAYSYDERAREIANRLQLMRETGARSIDELEP